MAKRTRRTRTSQLESRRSRPNYLPWIIGGLVAAIIIVVALVIANQSPVPAPTNSVLAQCGQASCGQANAPVTVDEYSDFQ